MKHDDDSTTSNPTENRVFADVLAERLSRRGMLGLLTGAAAAGMTTRPMAIPEAFANGSTLTFKELKHGYDEKFHVAEGYDAKVLARWGDKVASDAPAFDPTKQTPAAASKQFGYNCDFVGYFPIPWGSRNSEHGVLVVNNEYPSAHLMFAGLTEADYAQKMTPEQIDIEMAATGASMIEVRMTKGAWSVVDSSKYGRRIHAATEMRLSGPAAGHDRLKTKADPTGTRVLGTINNCAGGVMPWGTVLIAEENFHQYFLGDPAKTGAEAGNHKRYGLNGKPLWVWGRTHARFNVESEPTEPNRFGWMVEFDPYNPNAVPTKRTALGRFKHEGATAIVNKDGRVVLYSGDDERFDYIYKFVTAGTYDPVNREANRDLLDSGTLYVAKFDADGSLTWLPLAFGNPWLTPDQGFKSQADVLIETRRAADLLGATPMDRPEDIETNPVTGVVYVALTNNTSRKPDRLDAVNPRPDNKHGHVIEMIPPGRGADADHTATTYKWGILLMAGDPAKDADKAKYNPAVSADGWLSCPDNVAFDGKGRLWISTDGAPGAAGFADGIWATDIEGSGRALTRHFLRTPRGAEMCGPCFTPDDRTLFVAVQHPAEEKDSTYDKPTTRWPDFKAGMPPRPAVVAITKRGGGVIGS